MSHPLLDKQGGARLLLLGNEAIVRGALEAGVNVVVCYPGTPSSEVPDTFYRLSRETDSFRFEYSVNEKVAVEVGAGASLAGAMCLATMKHVGVNVAADPLFTAAYTGTPGGLVLLSADDPLCHSSQNEQDNRRYARFMGMPCFEPASAQEAKDMTRDALLLSRRRQQPVLLRTTTRVNHLRGAVTLGDVSGPAPLVPFERDPGRFVPVPAAARRRHRALVENLEAIRAEAEHSPWNRVSGQGRTGVIASGVSRAYLADALAAQGWEDRVRVLELGFSWPLPEDLIASFLAECDRVLVLEELEPLLESEVRELARRRGLATTVTGKGGPLTVFGEYSVRLVTEALAPLLGVDLAPLPAPLEGTPARIPGRPPNLCAGCSHRASYYAARKVFGEDAVYSSDIGCYTLGLLPPLGCADFLYCMGSSVSAGSGFAMVSQRPVVAFIGDSTFFHSGLSGLANAVFNRHNLVLMILDNGTTAMTGHQPNPGVSPDVLGNACVHLDIEAAVRGCGVTDVSRIKPYNVRAAVRVLEGVKARSGVRVVIAEEPCVLFARRLPGHRSDRVAYAAEQSPSMSACAAEFACPAFIRQGDTVRVDEELCTGCMVCLQLSSGFRAKKRGEPC